MFSVLSEEPVEREQVRFWCAYRLDQIFGVILAGEAKQPWPWSDLQFLMMERRRSVRTEEDQVE